jgi:deoxyribodipyrimidine photo-lyase
MHLVWHRTELRTHDHPALDAAARSGEAVLPLVVIDPVIFDRPTTTPRRRAWFLENVRALRASYRALGADLVVREGVPHEVLGSLARQAGVTHAHYIRNHTPYAKERDGAADRALVEAGVEVRTYPGQYTRPPGEVLTGAGTRYSVFGPYARKWLSLPLPELAPTPDRLPPVPRRIARGEIPVVQSDIPLPDPGEEAALARLETFLRDGEAAYATARNFPARRPGTSLLSMYFNIGVLGPRVAVRRARDAKWRSELAWWDFNAEVLDRQPEGATLEYKVAWRGFPWRHDDEEIGRWEAGMTGFPMVDAGMRELRATGFMHNRARLVTASFLTKHLLIDWRAGESVFRGLLLCGDSAQNIGNWQWVAGCGYDASPYFRVLNPVSQGEKFDPEGDYVRRWVPELAGLPGKAVHRPWKAASPPRGYPPPMIDLDAGRERFLRTAREFLGRRPARPRAGG